MTDPQIPIAVDPVLPPGTAELRLDGIVVGRIVNLDGPFKPDPKPIKKPKKGR